MELPEITAIGVLRRSMGLTQKELARKSGVSQSLIARIERGTVDPSYSKVARIFSALNEKKEDTIKATELMTIHVVEAMADDKLGQVIGKMREYQVSQLPVFDGLNHVGSISEGVILSQISKEADINEISGKKVREYMEEPFPIVAPATEIGIISRLLERNKAVLVSSGRRIEGIITRADLLKVVRADFSHD